MKQTYVAFIGGIVIGGAATYLALGTGHPEHLHSHSDTHPIGYANNADEVHVHSDFLVVINGEQIDFSQDKYQTTNEQELSDYIHLHDNVGHVIHRHADAVTLAEFFNSLGFQLTDSSISIAEGETFTSNNSEALLVYVNGQVIDNPSSYVNQEEDQILVYYGDPNDTERIAALLDSITNEACIYSGTCPERGVAPPESCGLSCDI
jgi:hypothetical protein